MHKQRFNGMPHRNALQMDKKTASMTQMEIMQNTCKTNGLQLFLFGELYNGKCSRENKNISGALFKKI